MAESSTEAKGENKLLNHVEISVPESEKRINGSLNIREYYTVYLVEVKPIDPNFDATFSQLGETIWRRYTDFEQVHRHLVATYPYAVVPPLPEKRAMFAWQRSGSIDSFDPDFVDRRRAGLENFLLRIAAHPILSEDKCFREFLVHDETWREGIRTDGYLQAAESKLRHLTLALRLRQPDPRFDAIKTYSNHLQSNLYALLKARAHCAQAQYTVYRLHANYGRVFSEWSAVEPAPSGCGGGIGGADEDKTGDALQKTGHYMDSLASSVDAMLEDEELFVDQLKEYLFFASALQTVCRHQEVMKLEVETAEDSVQAKSTERFRAEQGKIGLMSRLFGTIDTDEVRELRVNMLDQEIEASTTEVNSNKEELKDFSSRAINDVERFQKQKVLDLKETLSAYAFLQLKTAKKGLQTWTQIRDCLQNM